MIDKVKFIVAIVIAVVFVGLISCLVIYGVDKIPSENEVYAETEFSYDFTFVDSNIPYALIMYDNRTKVMYSVSYGRYIEGTLTVLVNADGTPLLWKGE